MTLKYDRVDTLIASLAKLGVRLGAFSRWWFEIRNILVVNERRQRIAESDAAAFLQNLSRLRIRVDRGPEESAILRLARSYRLSVYDAAYLELAQRERLQLATLDTDLQTAAAAEGVDTLSPGVAQTGAPR